MAIDPIAVQALARVMGRDHVLEVIQDAFAKLFREKKFALADKLVSDFANTGFPGWALLGAFAASYEHRDKLPSRRKLHWQALTTITKEHGSAEANRVLSGLE